MKKLIILLLLICSQLVFGQTGILSWQNPGVNGYRADIYSTPILEGGWQIYLSTNNPVTNKVLVPLTNQAGFFYGKYTATNYSYITNVNVSTNLIVSTNTFSTNTVTVTAITVAWDASPSPGVAGYKIYNGVASRTYTNTLSVGAALQGTVSNLNTPADYFFAATAYDTNGIESDYSTEADALNYVGSTNVTYTTNVVYSTNYTYITNSAAYTSNLFLTLTPVLPPPVSKTNTFTFTASGVTIRDNTTGSPFPSTLLVSGVTGTVDKVTVTLNNLTHTWSGDIDIMLSSPSNQTVLIMSDCGNGSVLNNANFVFDSTASPSLNSNGVPALASGTYKPSNYTENWSPTDSFPGAPAPVNTNTLAIFNNKNPNGVWNLWVVDDGPNDAGTIGSWSIAIRTFK